MVMVDLMYHEHYKVVFEWTAIPYKTLENNDQLKTWNILNTTSTALWIVNILYFMSSKYTKMSFWFDNCPIIFMNGWIGSPKSTDKLKFKI